MGSVNIAEDYFHAPKPGVDWRESYYFNFVDLEDGISGFTTIGILPNQNKAEFVMVLFYDDKQEVYFAEKRVASREGPANLLSDQQLSYELIEPLKNWRIRLLHENLNLELLWQARFPAFDFGKGSGTSWEGHFEQSGSAKGELSFSDGRRIEIKGYGQRDKSWGPRDWHIDGWYALQAQFDSFAMGIRRDMVKGSTHASGGMFSAKTQTAARDIAVEVACTRNQPRTPSGAVTTIHFVDGTSCTLRSFLVSPTSFIKFSRPFSGGSTELFEGMAIHECMETGEKGTGLLEFLTTRKRTAIR